MQLLCRMPAIGSQTIKQHAWISGNTHHRRKWDSNISKHLRRSYQIFVTGPSHVPINQVIVTSAKEPVYTVFIARRAVSYSITVVPTTFDKAYTVTLEADFETRVLFLLLL